MFDLKIEVQKIAKKNKATAKVGSAKFSNDKIGWVCKNGHNLRVSYSDMREKAKKGLPFCHLCAKEKEKERLFKIVKEIAKKNGGKCLSDKYENARVKLDWECHCGYRWKSAPYVIKSGKWCRKCADRLRAEGKKKYDLKFIQNKAEEMGGSCISKVYKNTTNKLDWKCSDGHMFSMSLKAILNGSWCPSCSKGLGERLVRTCFEKLFLTDFPSKKPDWLKNDRGNRMELDGYSEKLGIAFEHQGEQHYTTSTHFIKTKKKLESRKKDDRKKIRECKKRNIILIQVPEVPRVLKLKDLKKFIIEELKAAGYNVGPKIIRRRVSYSESYSPGNLEKLRKIAEKKGGRLLADSYLGSSTKLKVVCNEGHEWMVSPEKLKMGRWCPRCARRGNHGGGFRVTIPYIQELAKEHGGECLSKRFIKGNKQKFRCHKGHEWSTHYSLVRNGHWCPTCASDRVGDNNRGSRDKYEKIAIGHGGKLITRGYKTAVTPMKWECKFGHRWMAKPNAISNGSWCPDCSHTKPKSIKEMQDIAKARGGKCLSKTYKNSNTKLKWQCNKGHTWMSTQAPVRRGSWCPFCATEERAIARKEKEAIAFEKFLKKIFLKMVGDYKGNNMEISFECRNGHKFKSKPSNLKTRVSRGGYPCPMCKNK